MREGLIVRLVDEAGRIGFGEAAPVPGFSTETIAELCAGAHRLGKNPCAEVLDKIPAHLPTLRWAVACARAMGEGLFAQPLRTRPLAVAALLPAGPAAPAVLAERAAAGYRVFKWKIATRPLREELKIFEKLLDALPRDGRLRLDANGGLSARSFAAWTTLWREMGTRAHAVEFLEQPFSVHRPPAAWRHLVKKSPVPVALDESVAGWRALKQWHTAGWHGPLVVKPALLGDLPPFLLWRNRARADLVYSSAFETSIGLHAALWLAATDPRANRRALGFGTREAWTDDSLQLPVHQSAPRLAFSPISIAVFSTLWNRLPH